MLYMGVDVGSVSTDIALLDKNFQVVEGLYLKTKGKPVAAIQEGFKILKGKYSSEEICAVGCTGSGRQMTSYLIGADLVKNEITAHAVAALKLHSGVKTIIEIGGQDSKIITINNGVVTDFAMNTVCAAGTGSFLDRQAERLDIPIEFFGEYAAKGKNPVRIAGRCAVFAESDMIHKQQLGYSEENIISGLCEALVRNYLSNVAKGKVIKEKILFQGGVAANIGMKAAFEKALGEEVIVPTNYNLIGAIGAAIIAAEKIEKEKKSTKFKGFQLADTKFISNSFECEGCANKCEVVEIITAKQRVGCFGDRCGKWSNEEEKIKLV